MSDGTDTTSCVSHRPNTRFMIIFDDYLDIASVSEHQYKLAAFWRVMETKTNDRKKYNAQLIEDAHKKGLAEPETTLWIELSYAKMAERALDLYKESAFQVAAAESERLGFTKSRTLKRRRIPGDPDSPLVDYKEYLFLTDVMQTTLSTGKIPAPPVDFNSPLLISIATRKERKRQEKEAKKAVENNTPVLKSTSPPIEINTDAVDFNSNNNITGLPKDNDPLVPGSLSNDSLSASADAGQISQQQPSPAPTITPSSSSYSQSGTTHQPSPTISALPPDAPQGVIALPSSQHVIPHVAGPMTTGNPPVEPVETPITPLESTTVPAVSLRLTPRGVLTQKEPTKAPAVLSVQESDAIPRVYDRSVKIADCPPDIASRRRLWQKHFNARRGDEPLDQSGPRIEEAKAIADLVARYSDEQIRAIDTHVLGSFPYNQPGRQFEVSGTVVFARSQAAREALKSERKWPRSPGEPEPMIPVPVMMATVHKSRYISSHLLPT